MDEDSGRYWEGDLLKIEGLCMDFGDFRALDNINFSLGKGRLVGLIGPNGCGKSTRMKCICKINQMTSGTITIDGNDVGSMHPSEIAKLGVILYFADSISKKKDKMRTLRYGILPYGFILVLIAVLMYFEPHLSGTVLILGIGAAMMFIVSPMRRNPSMRTGRISGNRLFSVPSGIGPSSGCTCTL